MSQVTLEVPSRFTSSLRSAVKVWTSRSGGPTSRFSPSPRIPVAFVWTASSRERRPVGDVVGPYRTPATEGGPQTRPFFRDCSDRRRSLPRALHRHSEGGGARVAARVGRRATDARATDVEPAARVRPARHPDRAVNIVLRRNGVGDADMLDAAASAHEPAGETADRRWRQVPGPLPAAGQETFLHSLDTPSGATNRGGLRVSKDHCEVVLDAVQLT